MTGHQVSELGCERMSERVGYRDAINYEVGTLISISIAI